MFWGDFNEVFGCLGQMAKNKELRPALCNYLSRGRFESIAEPLRKLLNNSYNSNSYKNTDSIKRNEHPHPAFD